MRRRAMIRLMGLVAVVAAAGCDGPKNKVVPVTGKVVFADGKPLPAGTTVLFEPVEGGVGTASGEVGADGSFTMTHATAGAGAEVGKYTVKLYPPRAGAAEFYRAVAKDFAEGGLSVEVKDGMSPVELKVPQGKGRR